MPYDIDHWWGDDISPLTPSGDLPLVIGIAKSNQRIFRRLCTNGKYTGAKKAEYLFHPTYGGSLPWYVGRLARNNAMSGLIRTQMYHEASVSQTPEPSITVTTNPNGTFSAKIKYTDVDGNQSPLIVLDVPGDK